MPVSYRSLFSLTRSAIQPAIPKRLLMVVLTWITCCLPGLVAATPTLEDFGSQPFIRNMAISPDGTRYAWIQEKDNKKVMIVYDAKKKEPIAGLKIKEDIKARDVEFASDDYLIIDASQARTLYGVAGRFEHSAAFSYQLENKKFKRLLTDTDNLHPNQSGLGFIVGIHKETDFVYMPAFDDSTTPHLNLYKVSLKTGKGKIFGLGSTTTTDWFVSSDGKILAREDFDPEKEKHTFYSYASGKKKEIYSYQTKIPKISVQAVARDEKHLLFIKGAAKNESVHALNLEDGSISHAIFHQENKDIDHLITDISRKLVAVKYSGFLPTYEFSEDEVQAAFGTLMQKFSSSSVDLLGKTDDNQLFLIRTSGNTEPEAFYSFDAKKKQLFYLTRGYPSITLEDLGQVTAFKYPARDGLKIPAVLTWPQSKSTKSDRQNLPLIVLPHGGPDAYDSVSFDWLSQFLAHKGYAVLQPNFRGSTGFGAAFHNAGIGKWGKEMQDDITDGVHYLVKKGIADERKVCIMGSSYGGYAALAGAAFTPELYRCVISINGVSDIHAEIRSDIRRYEKEGWLINHWENVFDKEKADFKQLNEVSPYYYADRFQSPTLIVYSKDDSVVTPQQSRKMHKALKKANKESTLVALKGEDHWMSTSPMRIELLRTLEAFLNQHNPIP